MAQLVVRNLDADLVQALRRRAAEEGCSAEELHRRILRSALRSEGLRERLLAIPPVGEDGDFERDPSPARTVDL
ncbi:MAG: FitA-like ribbon-helix-helix domain-containing protein [Acidimicrobiales bacterium]